MSQQLENLLDVHHGCGMKQTTAQDLVLVLSLSRNFASLIDANPQHSRDCGKPVSNRSSSVVVVLDTTELRHLIF